MFSELWARLFGFGPEEPPAQPEHVALKSYGDIPAVYRSNYDGDTITVDIPGAHPAFGSAVGVRLAGIDCPEVRDPRPEVRRVSQQAKEFTRQRLARFGQKAGLVLVGVRRDKYFRLLAGVLCDGEDLANALLVAGLARPYDGGTRLPW